MNTNRMNARGVIDGPLLMRGDLYVDGAVIGNGGGVVNVKAQGAKGDGVSDDYAATQMAITAAVPGSVVALGPGDYLLAQGLLLVNKQRITIRGAGRGITRLIVTDQLLTQNGFPSTLNATCGVLTLFGCSDVTLEDFDIVGPESWRFTGGFGGEVQRPHNPATNILNAKGIAIRDRNDHITLRNLGIRNLWSEAVYFDATIGNPANSSRYLTFDRLDIRDSWHDGIAINNGYTRDVKIINCTIENVGGDCVESVCEGLLIANNYFAQPNRCSGFLLSLTGQNGTTIVANNTFGPSDVSMDGSGAMLLQNDVPSGTRYQSSFVINGNLIHAIKTNTNPGSNFGAIIDVAKAKGLVSITNNVITGCGRVNASDPPPAAILLHGAQTNMVYIAGNIISRALNTVNPDDNGPYYDVPWGVGNQEVGIRIAADVPVGNHIVIGDNLILANTPTDFAVAPMRAA